MAEPLRPTSNKTFGRENWIFVPTIAGYSTGTGPTVAEITGASSLDITRIAFADGAPATTQTTNRVKQNRRLGDTTVTEFIGETDYEGGDMTYLLDPQAVAGSDGKKAWEKFLNSSGTITGYLVRRLGVGRAVTPVAGQFVDVYPVEIGPSIPTTTGDAESAETAATATFAITDAPLFVTAVAA